MKRIINGIIAVLIMSTLGVSSAYAANPASFTISASASVTTGSTFSVTVSENGDQVNTVTAKLVYDTAKLQLLGVSCGGSFGGSIAETDGVTCYTSGGTSVTGSAVAASASFKALAEGTASISMSGSSSIVSGGTDIWNHGSTARSITVVAPTPAPTPTPSPSTPVTTSTSTAKTQNGQSSTNAATTTDAASQSAQAASADTSQNASGTPVMQVAAIATDQPVSGLSFNVMLPLAIAVGVSVVTAAALLMWIRPRELDQPTLGKK